MSSQNDSLQRAMVNELEDLLGLLMGNEAEAMERAANSSMFTAFSCGYARGRAGAYRLAAQFLREALAREKALPIVLDKRPIDHVIWLKQINMPGGTNG